MGAVSIDIQIWDTERQTHLQALSIATPIGTTLVDGFALSDERNLLIGGALLRLFDIDELRLDRLNLLFSGLSKKSPSSSI